MGLAFIFRLDESSLAGHVGERAPRTAADTESIAITEAGNQRQALCCQRIVTMLGHDDVLKVSACCSLAGA